MNKDWNVGIGVFPQGKKILIRGAGFGGVALHRIGAPQLEMGQRADRFIQNDAAMVEDFLKLCCRFAALMCGKIGFSSHINGVKIGPIVAANRRQTKFIRRSDLKNIKRLLWFECRSATFARRAGR